MVEKIYGNGRSGEFLAEQENLFHSYSFLIETSVATILPPYCFEGLRKRVHGLYGLVNADQSWEAFEKDYQARNNLNVESDAGQGRFPFMGETSRQAAYY